MFIDSHAHLTGDTLYPEVETLLQRAQESGVEKIINICTDLKTLERGLELSKSYPWVLNAGSTTPHDVEKEGELFFDHFKKAACEGHFVAVGETGLDYFYEHSKKEVQKVFFIRYLKLALELDLPVIIHCRDAFSDFFHIIDQNYPSQKGVLHCFTGTKQEALELVERGWMVSFSGIVTFKKSHELREALSIVPLNQLLIETDAPYLAPQSKRGKRNEPSFIKETALMVAEVKQISLQEVAKQTRLNASRLFQIPCG